MRNGAPFGKRSLKRNPAARHFERLYFIKEIFEKTSVVTARASSMTRYNLSFYLEPWKSFHYFALEPGRSTFYSHGVRALTRRVLLTC